MNEQGCCGSQLNDVKATKEVAPAVDIALDESTGAYRIVVDLPGVNEADVEVQAHDGELEIVAGVGGRDNEGDVLLCEAPQRSYRRRFRLAEDIDVEKISAQFEAGVLTLDLPRVASAKPRKIEIRSAH